MTNRNRPIQPSIILTLLLAITAPPAFSQPARAPASRPAWIPQGYDDHQNMMDQLNIKSLRPGKNGNKQTGKGFDDLTGNDMMTSLPDVLKMNDGTKVTTVQQWPKRRAEILEDFEREVYGRIPKSTPKVTWEVVSTTNTTQNGIPTSTQLHTGHVDNSLPSQITVNIHGSFTKSPPNATTGQLPIMIEFGGVAGTRWSRSDGFAFGARRAAAQQLPRNPIRRARTHRPQFSPPLHVNNPQGVGGPDRSRHRQRPKCHPTRLGLRRLSTPTASNKTPVATAAPCMGIIGLCNKGEPRKPDDLRGRPHPPARLGVSELIEYFAANPDSHVDRHQARHRRRLPLRQSRPRH